MIRPAAVFFSAFVAMTCMASAAPTCDRALYVGAWNIQWLGNAKAGKRQPQKPQDLAAYIQTSKTEVLGLAEITATAQDMGVGGARYRNDQLDATFAILNASGARWTYALFPKRQGARDPSDQWTGIAWNEAAVAKVGGPWPLDVQVDAAREEAIRQDLDEPEASTIVLSRWPFATKFSKGAGKTDFIVVPIHLKSNIGGGATAQARAYEAELILEGLGKLDGDQADADVIVMGDTNILSSQEAASGLFSAAGLRDCNARDLATHLSFKPGEKGAPFDRIYVVAAQPETAEVCPMNGNGSRPEDFKIVRPTEWKTGMTNSEFKRRLSDHLLVRAGICVMADDD